MRAPHPRPSPSPPTLRYNLETWGYSNISLSLPQTPPAPSLSFAPLLAAKTTLNLTLRPPLAPPLEMCFP